MRISDWSSDVCSSDLVDETERVDVGDDLLARDIAIETAINLGRFIVDGCSRRENVDQWLLVALAERVVVEVMRRRDFHAAGAEFAIDVIVGDDRDLAVRQRQQHGLADQMTVTPILGMNETGRASCRERVCKYD